jgi:hypothetical protein
VSQNLVPLIGACATWLDRAYGPGASAFADALVRVQTRQATTVAAWLRFPTDWDAALVHLCGPASTGELDTVTGRPIGAGQPWRTWVDATVVSWAACLLIDTDLSRRAVAAVADTEHAQGLCLNFRSLVQPDEHEARAGALLRHPDLVEPVAVLHRPTLLDRLAPRGN